LGRIIPIELIKLINDDNIEHIVKLLKHYWKSSRWFSTVHLYPNT